MPKQPGQSAAQKRIARTEAYAASIGRMFDETVSDILKLKLAKPTEEGVMYSFDGDTMQVRKKVEALLKRLHGAATLAIAKGVEKEWNIANQECDDLVKNIFGKKLFESDRFRAWTAHNEGAMNAFINRSDKGMNLSDRIWKSARQLRDEMEVALTVGMAEGDSAAGLSRQVRQCLNDPDLMFRRFRYKKGEDENGNPIWGRKWKKKVIEDGKTKWIDYDKDSYIPKGAGDHSRGVYKSAAKNAMRVARTETNMAYRRSDYERWQQMSFILGIRIEMSNQHPKPDICDEMQGDYPKNFYFSGWHPMCFCYATPILISEDEMAKVNSEFLQGRTYQPQGQPVLDTPPNFKQWVSDNSDRIRNANSLPYWIKDNPMFVDAKKGVALTPDPANIEALFPKNTATKNHELLDQAKAAMPEEGSEALNKRFASLQDAVNGDMGEEEVQRLYDRVIAGIETQKKWDALVWDGFEEGQRKALEEFGKAIGMKKGRPMTHVQADTGKVNPLYQPKFIKDKYGFWQRNPKYKKGYTINCQTCAPVYALRRMGFNIEAGEYTKKIPSFKYLAQNYRQAWKWRDPRNYKSTHKPSDMFNAANAEKDSVWQVQCVWKGGRSGHTFNLVNDNGKTFFYDPQTNKRFNTLEEFREYSDKVSPTYGFQYFRIDKKWVDSTWLSKNVLAAQTRMTPEEIRRQEIMNKARKRHEARPADYREKLLERRSVTQEADRLLKKAEDFAWNQGIADKGDTLRHVRFAKDTDVEKIKKNIDGLKKRIDKQKQIITNTSKNLDKLATKYEYSQDIKDKVEAMQNASTYTEMRQKQRELAKAISAEVKDNRILSELIPDVEKWKKQFTSEELHGAFDAVKKKLDSIQYESLENQKKQLEKEQKYVGDPTYLKPHKLHSTSPVAEAAYTKQLQKVEIQIKTNELKAELTSLKTPLAKTFKSLSDELDDIDTLISEGKLTEAEKKIASAKQTKMVVDKYEALSSYHTPKFDAMLAEAKDLLDKGDMTSASVKLSEAEKIKTKNEQSKASKAKKAESKKNLEAEIKEATDLAWDDIQKQFLDGKVKFKLGIDKKIDAALASGDFKKAQKLLKDNFNIDVLDENNQYREAARKAGTAQGSVKFDNSCFTQQRKNSAKWCKTAKDGNNFFFDEDSVDQWLGFTEDQKDALYRYTSGSSYLTEPLRAIKGHYYAYDGRPIAQDIENATAALNKCALKKDAWVKRDDNPWCVEYAFGIPDLNAYKTDPSKLVGMTGIDRSFMSCATAKESYFGTKEVVYNIYCPKGTKGIYAETFSAFGKQKRNFDGKTRPTGVDKYNENEFLLQRGAIMRITKAEYNVNDRKWYIDVEVLGHKIEDYELKKGSGGWYCDFK